MAEIRGILPLRPPYCYVSRIKGKMRKEGKRLSGKMYWNKKNISRRKRSTRATKKKS